MMKQRKFKSLITLYYNFDNEGECIETQKPYEKDAEYTFARKGSIFTIKKIEEINFEYMTSNWYHLTNGHIYILLEGLDEVDKLIKDGWFKEIK